MLWLKENYGIFVLLSFAVFLPGTYLLIRGLGYSSSAALNILRTGLLRVPVGGKPKANKKKRVLSKLLLGVILISISIGLFVLGSPNPISKSLFSDVFPITCQKGYIPYKNRSIGVCYPQRLTPERDTMEEVSPNGSVTFREDDGSLGIGIYSNFSGREGDETCRSQELMKINGVQIVKTLWLKELPNNTCGELEGLSADIKTSNLGIVNISLSRNGNDLTSTDTETFNIILKSLIIK